MSSTASAASAADAATAASAAAVADTAAAATPYDGSGARGLRLGDQAPDFEAMTQDGPLRFHAATGDRWAILFSHPADFTPVCTTELAAVARLQPEWERRGVVVVGLSCDRVAHHRRWIQEINSVGHCKVRFPIVADPDRRIARQYAMLDHQDPSNTDDAGMPLTVRSVFIIDPRHVIRLIQTYPAAVGRNFDEILRCVDALQLTDRYPVATPADWALPKQPNRNVLVHVGISDDEARARF
ncbi:thioredoxin-like protein, partial [Caulochytrium protostelioides]